MKISILSFVLLLCISSCNSNQNKMTTPDFKESTLKSDVLIQTSAAIPFSKPTQKDIVTLSVSGKTILNGLATFMARDASGNEIYCETFPAKKLIQPEYKTANSVLQEIHIREVVDGYFVDSETLRPNDSLRYVSL